MRFNHYVKIVGSSFSGSGAFGQVEVWDLRLEGVCDVQEQSVKLAISPEGAITPAKQGMASIYLPRTVDVSPVRPGDEAYIYWKGDYRQKAEVLSARDLDGRIEVLYTTNRYDKDDESFQTVLSSSSGLFIDLER